MVAIRMGLDWRIGVLTFNDAARRVCPFINNSDRVPFLQTCPFAFFVLLFDSGPVSKIWTGWFCTLCFLYLGPRICTWDSGKT